MSGWRSTSQVFAHGLTALFLFILGLALPCSHAYFECEELGVYECAFAVASSGARCILETEVLSNGAIEFECKTSVVIAPPFTNWIETVECILFCGLERLTIGISTDFIGDFGLQEMICSPMCQHHCPNIVDLFSKLSIGEGLDLRDLCKEGEVHHFKPKGSSWPPLPIESPSTLPMEKAKN